MPRFKDVFRAYRLTISTKGDISEETQKKTKKWLDRTCKYVLCVVENNTGKRHLHAAMYFDEPKNKKQLQEYIWRHFVKPFHEDSMGKYAVLINVMYNSEWVETYLQKDETREVLLSHLPNEETPEAVSLNEFYPTPEEQEALQAAKDKPSQSDSFLDIHEERYKLYLEHEGLSSSITVATEYFLWRVNVDRSMSRLRDSRSYVNMGLALHRYITMDKNLTAEEHSLIRRVTESFDFSGRS